MDFVPLTRELIPGCLDMLNMWTEENYARLDGSIHYEHDAIMRAFAVYGKACLEGGVLRSGGKIIGFSMGEMAGRDTFDVHFEKADIDINGAYPMVCLRAYAHGHAEPPGASVHEPRGRHGA